MYNQRLLIFELIEFMKFMADFSQKSTKDCESLK